MIQERQSLIYGLLLAVDLALVAAAFVIAHWLRDDVLPWLGLVEYGLYPLGRYLGLLPLALAVAAVLRSVLDCQGLLAIGGIGREGLRLAVLAIAIGASLVVSTYALRNFDLPNQELSRLWVGLFVLTTFVLLFSIRLVALLTGGFGGRRLGGRHNILIYGAGEAALEGAHWIAGRRLWGYNLVGFLATDSDPAHPGCRPLLGSAEDLAKICEERVVDDVLFCVSHGEVDELQASIEIVEQLGIGSHLALSFAPAVPTRVVPGRLGRLPIVSFSHARLTPVKLLLKRLLDIVVSAALLLLLAPLLVAIAVLVRATSQGPVLYRQRRVGLNGRPFVLLKFRSMVVDAEARQAEIAHLNQLSGPVFKIEKDPRVTRIGRTLRRYSLDELPQLWNVFKGEMSLVGPRPQLPAEVESYERWQRRRLSMRPGLTCLWQIRGRNQIDFTEWMQMDLEYIDSWSFWLDLRILFLTLPAVVGGRGAS